MKKFKLHKNETYGIEIEFATSKVDEIEKMMQQLKETQKINDCWILKEEATCDEIEHDKKGYEINSPVMDHQNHWIHELKIMLKVLEKYTTITSTCAIHFHLGEQIFEENTRYLQDFLLMWSYYEPIIYRFSTGEYNEIRPFIASYAKPLNISMSNQQISALEHHLEMKEFLTQFMKEFGKIFAVNLNPYYYAMKYRKNKHSFWEKATVEFRTFATTYQYDVIYSYLEMILEMIEHVKTLSLEERSLYLESLKNRKKYIDPNSFSSEEMNMNPYFQLNMKKALEFSKLIYQDEKEQKQFMKIYTHKRKSYE